MDVLGRIDELERDPCTSFELVDRYGDPLVQLVSAVQAVPVRLDYLRLIQDRRGGRKPVPPSRDSA
jgi:hypothetical protein